MLAWQTPRGLPNGDAALYAQQAMALDFGERTVHIGYYALVAALTGFASDVPDRVFNLLSVLGACATMALISILTAQATGRRDLGFAAGFSLLGSYVFVRNAVWAEIYIFQALFFVLACWLFWRGVSARAGVSLALSVLISPSMLLGVPALIVGRPRVKAIVVLGAVGGGLVLACLAFVWRDFFLGPRGLFGAAGASAGLAAGLIKEAFEVIYGVGFLVPFALAGAHRGLRSPWWRIYLVGILLLWLPTFLLAEKFADVPVQLPTWILLAPVLGLGLGAAEAGLESRGPKARRWLLAAGAASASLPLAAVPWVARRAQTFAALSADSLALLWTFFALTAGGAVIVAARRPQLAVRVLFISGTAIGAALSGLLVAQLNHSINSYRSTILALKEEVRVDYLTVGTWEQGVLAEHYAERKSYTGRSVLAGDLEASQPSQAWRRVRSAMDRGHEIWLFQQIPALEAELGDRGWSIRQLGRARVAKPP
ncbi:MAG: hypothetical protein AAF725_26935 [Acidobacteriota bacterium]